MSNFYKRQYIQPKDGFSFPEQLQNCIKQLEEINQNNYLIQLTFFIRSINNNNYLERKNLIISTLKKVFNKNLPSTGIIGQYPDNNEIGVEIIWVNKNISDIEIYYKNLDNIIYTVIKSHNNIDLFAGGITSDNMLNSSLVHQAEAAFGLMDTILNKESITFANVVRQWNYVEDIIGYEEQDNKKLQNYQTLNDIRSKYYSKIHFLNGYPAATGIGMNAGGIILEFYASKANQEVMPIISPEQKNAYDYSQNVLIGNSLDDVNKKTSPKFERAKLINFQDHKKIFISGTASIKQEKTVGIDNIETQTKVTIENIKSLISHDNLTTNNILINYNSFEYSFIRVYVKNADQIKKVKNICSESFPAAQINYLIADICRENLLVEIEGEGEFE